MANEINGGQNAGDNSDDSLSRDLADIGEEEPGKKSTKSGNEEDAEDSEDEGDSEELKKFESDDSDDEDDDKEDSEDGEESEDGDDKGTDDKSTDKDETEDASGDTRVSVKAIKGKYPNLFRDFPSLRAAFFEYPRYREIFPDTDSARSASVKADEFDALEGSLVKEGDPKLLLKVLSENSPKSFKKVVESFATAVRETDPNTYTAFINPVIEELLYHAATHGQKIGDKNLQLAARHLANFVWANGGDVPDISKRQKSGEKSDAEKELEQERESYAREKYQTALTGMISVLTKEMDEFVGSKLSELTTFEKKQVIKEVRAELDKTLSSDKSFQQTMRGLWKRAAESNYSTESKSRIKRAWLDRARLVAPRIRARLKQEALNGRSNSKGESKNKEGGQGLIKFREESVRQQKRTFPSSGQATSGARSGSQRTVLDPGKIDWRKTSDMDILNSK